MPIRTQSADGITHEFPDGTPDDVVDRVMKDYSASKSPVTRQAATTPSESYTGSILPLRRDESGLHLAVPESIASLARGMTTGGQRAMGTGETGQNPLRPLSPDQLGAAMSLSPTTAAVSKAASVLPSAVASSTGMTAERALLAKEARDVFGIPLTAAQIGTSPMIKTAESAISKLPLSGARGHELETKQAFNRAVSRSFGEAAKTITPDVMLQAKTRIGGVINKIENNTEVGVGSAKLMSRLAAIETNAHEGLTAAEYAVVARLLNGVIRNVTPGDKLTGTTYGNLLHRDSPLDHGVANSNSNIARAAQQIKTALQDALQDSLSGADLEAYRNARFEYKNMKTIEPLVNKAPTGDISPALLNARVSAQFPNRAYDTSGTNPLDRLAKIAQAFLKEPGTSQTTERAATLHELAKIGGMIAAGDLLGIPTALAGTAATLGTGRAIGSYLRSPGLANRTIEKALRPPPTSPGLSGPGLLYRASPGLMMADEPPGLQYGEHGR